MRLNLTQNNPVVWAMSGNGEWAVRRSPGPDAEGMRAYYVRRHCEGFAVIRARWIKHFLEELAKRAGVAYVTLYTGKDEPEGNYIMIGSKSRSKAA